MKVMDRMDDDNNNNYYYSIVLFLLVIGKLEKIISQILNIL